MPPLFDRKEQLLVVVLALVLAAFVAFAAAFVILAATFVIAAVIFLAATFVMLAALGLSSGINGVFFGGLVTTTSGHAESESSSDESGQKYFFHF